MAATRRSPGLVRYKWTFSPIRQLSARIAGQGRTSSDAIRRAHADMAKQLQIAIRQELQDQMEHRGDRGIGPRHQRGTDYLLKAIVSDKNRKVDTKGFAVGFLDDYKQGGVNLYYRNLEVGSRVHVGTTIYGVFLSKDGNTRPPTSNEAKQVDPRLIPMSRGGKAAGPNSYRTAIVNGRLKKVFVPEITIKNPIPAYHYFENAKSSFLAQGLELETALYEKAFSELGLDFFEFWMRAHGRAKPRASKVSFNFTRTSVRDAPKAYRQLRTRNLEGG